MIEALVDFHFIRPSWLLALPALLVLWFTLSRTSRSSEWHNYIPAEMLNALQLDSTQRSGHWRIFLLFYWLILSLAMAGPTWTKTALPTLVNQQALVLILDLSPSMMAEDVTPNRLTRAKYKLIDILRERGDGQVALIAYAGSAHTVSPLSDDPRTLEALLSALSPTMMPAQGSNIEAAIGLAKELLSNARATESDIILVTDGIAADALSTVDDQLSGLHRLSILAVGGDSPAPIPSITGGFVRSNQGEIVMAGVNNNALKSLASELGGRHVNLSNDDSDISTLLSDDFQLHENTELLEQVVYDDWVDMGHWLVLLILPIVAFSFRKGLVYLLPLILINPLDSQAASIDEFTWSDLWQSRDQQGAQLMHDKKYQEAANTFDNPDWSALANYRQSNYQQAADHFGNHHDIASLYNGGNSLAMSGDIEGAKESYKRVLEKDPLHEDAAFNLNLLEQMEGEDGESGDQDNESDQEQQENKSQENSQSQDQQESGEPKEDQSAQDDQSQDSNPKDGESEDDLEQPSDEQTPPSDEQEKDPDDADAEKQEDEEDSDADGEEQTSESQQDEAPASAEQVDIQEGEESDELADASEQWLRTINDDPSGLLRRKFEYQERQRQNEQGTTEKDPTDERY